MVMAVKILAEIKICVEEIPHINYTRSKKKQTNQTSLTVKISCVNVNNSAVFCESDHIYYRNP